MRETETWTTNNIDLRKTGTKLKAKEQIQTPFVSLTSSFNQGPLILKIGTKDRRP